MTTAASQPSWYSQRPAGICRRGCLCLSNVAVRALSGHMRSAETRVRIKYPALANAVTILENLHSMHMTVCLVVLSCVLFDTNVNLVRRTIPDKEIPDKADGCLLTC